MYDKVVNQLLEKMEQDHNDFREWLLRQDTKTILYNAHQYFLQEDILFAIEDANLSEYQAQALLNHPNPMQRIIGWFDRCDTNRMDVLEQSIENVANDLLGQEG